MVLKSKPACQFTLPFLGGWEKRRKRRVFYALIKDR
jgi:hypothetical protein